MKSVLVKEVLPESYNGEGLPAFFLLLCCAGDLFQVCSWTLSPFSSNAICENVLGAYKYILKKKKV